MVKKKYCIFTAVTTQITSMEAVLIYCLFVINGFCHNLLAKSESNKRGCCQINFTAQLITTF